MFFRYMSSISWMVGLLLLSLTIYGDFIFQPKVSMYAYKRHDPEKIIRKINKLSNTDNYKYSLQVANSFHEAISHKWDEEHDNTLPLSFLLNWSYQLRRFISNYRAYNFEEAYALTSKSAYEFTDYKNAIIRGVGICSQQALAVRDFMQKMGYESYVYGLNGHVVNLTRFSKNQKEIIIDSDFNVVMPFGMTYASHHIDKVEKFYIKAGLNASWAKDIARLFLNNPILFDERPADAYKSSIALNWLIPIALLLIGVLIKYRRRNYLNQSIFK